MKSRRSSLLRKILPALFAGILLFLSGSAAYTKQKNDILLGYAIFPDLSKTIDMIEKIAVKIDPERVKQGTMKAQIGTMLGDPTLSNFDKSRPLVATVYYQPITFGGTELKGLQNVSYAFYIPAKDNAKYKKIFDSMQMPSAIKGGVLVIGNKKASLDLALEGIDLYKKTAAEKVQSDMRFLLKIDNAITIFDKDISEFVSQMKTFDFQQSLDTGLPNQNESLISLGKLFLYGILDIASQSKNYQLDISVGEKNLLFSSEHSAKPGTPLYNFFNGTAPEKNSCLTLLPEKGDFTYAGYFDMKRLNNLIGTMITGAIKRDPSLKDKLDMNLINEYRNFIGYYLGEFAFAYGFDKDLKFRMDIAASTNRSAESHLSMNEKFISIYNETLKKMSPGAEKLYEYTHQKYVRKSGGFDVHRYIFKINYSSMNDTDKASMQKIFGGDFTTEYAVANGFVVMSTSPEALDTIIQNTVKGGGLTGIQSMKSFGAGMDSYYDFDIANFVKKIAAMSDSFNDGEKDPEMEEVVKTLNKLSPEDRTFIGSSKYSDGSSYNKYQISVKIITDTLKLINEQKNEQSIPKKEN